MVEIRAKIICDQCGATIEGPVEHRTTQGMRSYWEAKREAKKRHWLVMSRGRYRTDKHFCYICADGEPKV